MVGNRMMDLAETLELFPSDANLPDHVQVRIEKILLIHQLTDQLFRDPYPPFLRQIEQRSGGDLYRSHTVGEKPDLPEFQPLGSL